MMSDILNLVMFVLCVIVQHNGDPVIASCENEACKCEKVCVRGYRENWVNLTCQDFSLYKYAKRNIKAGQWCKDSGDCIDGCCRMSMVRKGTLKRVCGTPFQNGVYQNCKAIPGNL